MRVERRRPILAGEDGNPVVITERDRIQDDAIGGTAYLFYLAPQLTLGLLVGIPLVVLPIAWFGRKLRDVSRHSQDRVADVGSMVAETLGAMKVVQAFGPANHNHS